MVYQNSPQLLGRHCVKMGAILPVYWLGPDHPKVGFMHDCCGLQCMLAMLTAHFSRGNPMQLAVD